MVKTGTEDYRSEGRLCFSTTRPVWFVLCKFVWGSEVVREQMEWELIAKAVTPTCLLIVLPCWPPNIGLCCLISLSICISHTSHPRGRSHEARVSRFLRAKWEIQGKAYCFRNYNAMLRSCGHYYFMFFHHRESLPPPYNYDYRGVDTARYPPKQTTCPRVAYVTSEQWLTLPSSLRPLIIFRFSPDLLHHPFLLVQSP